MPELSRWEWLSPLRLWGAWPFSLRVCVCVSATFLLAALGTWFSGDRAVFSEWLAAVATLAAFVAAVVAARYASMAWAVEVKRDHYRDQLEKAAQASLIAVWVDEIVCARVNGRYELGDLSAHIRNASQLPATRVAVAFTVRRRVGAEAAFSDVDRLTLLVLPPASEPLTRLVPQLVRDHIQRLLDQGREPTDLNVLASIAFADAAGVHWIRGSDGRLQEAPEPLRRLREQNWLPS